MMNVTLVTRGGDELEAMPLNTSWNRFQKTMITNALASIPFPLRGRGRYIGTGPMRGLRGTTKGRNVKFVKENPKYFHV